jgi:hypothetical protein
MFGFGEKRMTVSENWVLAERTTPQGLSLVGIRRPGEDFPFRK